MMFHSICKMYRHVRDKQDKYFDCVASSSRAGIEMENRILGPQLLRQNVITPNKVAATTLAMPTENNLASSSSMPTEDTASSLTEDKSTQTPKEDEIALRKRLVVSVEEAQASL
jgi:hypothetical protein